MRHVTLSVLFALVLGSLGCGGESARAPAATTSAASSSAQTAPTTADPAPPVATTQPVDDEAWEEMQRICAVAECQVPDCRTMRCEPCGTITATHCVAGLCTAS